MVTTVGSLGLFFLATMWKPVVLLISFLGIISSRTSNAQSDPVYGTAVPLEQ